MKKLTGSEKQIKWAEQIRLNMINKLNKKDILKALKHTQYHLTFAKVSQLGDFNNVIALLNNQTAATFFIELRNEALYNVIAELMKTVELDTTRYSDELVQKLLTLDK